MTYMYTFYSGFSALYSLHSLDSTNATHFMIVRFVITVYWLCLCGGFSRDYGPRPGITAARLSLFKYCSVTADAGFAQL